MQDSKNLGGPLAARRTIYGSHTWSGGPSMATKIATNGPGGPVVAGDHLRRDRPEEGRHDISASKCIYLNCIFLCIFSEQGTVTPQMVPASNGRAGPTKAPQVVRPDNVKLPQLVPLCHRWSPTTIRVHIAPGSIIF